jgi:hypothetical protein
MTLRTYLLLFTLATVTAWVGWIVVLLSIDPFTSGTLWIFVFYASLFVGLFGFFSLIGFFFRTWFSEDDRLFRYLSVAARQGALLSGLIIGLLLLQASGYLVWWNVLLLMVCLFLIEWFFVNSAKPSK